MFEYFPGNYVWNLSVVATLNNGGLIDEVDRACRPLLDAATRGEDAGTKEFLDSWVSLVDQMTAEADRQVSLGHHRSAGHLTKRALNYLIHAERMQSRHEPSRLATYQRCLALAQRTFDLIDPATIRVAIDYEGTTLPAYFHPVQRDDGRRAPVMIMFNGLDSTKEHMYISDFWAEMQARGIATLMVDTPGSGEALRLQGLTARIDTEAWAAACIDWLARRADVDADRIGLVGWSLGGYYAPRAAAFEDRLALVVAWGANHDWGAVQRRRLEREGERPVPHYWDHVMWVWGFDDLDAFIAYADDVRLTGIIDRIKVPFLVCHGEHDRQIPLAYAQQSYDEAVNSPRRELRVFSAAEGGAEHIGLDHLPYVRDFIADWVAEAFAEMGPPGS